VEGWLFGGFAVFAFFGVGLFGFFGVGWFGLGAEEREEDYVADGFGVGEDHGEAVDADAFAGGGGKAVAEGADVVFVHVHGFFVATVFLGELRFEAGALVVGVV
jgi:hypothetical protein